MRGNVHSTTQQLHFSLAHRALLSIIGDLEMCRRLVDGTGADTIGEDKIAGELGAFKTLLENVLDEVEQGLYLLKRSVAEEGPLREE